MGKKLLFLVFILLAYLSPSIGWAQSCPDPEPTVNIDYSGASSVCDIDTISINSTIPTTSPAPTESYTYQWQSSRNSGSWNNISGATSTDLDYIPSNFTPSSGNFRFRLIVSYCSGTVPSAPSSNITVNTLRIPSVSISTSSQTICAGQHLTFTATPTNGGNNPSYQWQINGSNVGTNSPTFSTSAQGINLQNNDKVTVILTSNVTCPDPANNPKTSNELTIIVNPILVPAVNISESTNNICPGNNITFTATPVNGGTPSYQWKVDGTNVGTNSSSFSSTTLTDNQEVTVVMTSTAICASPTTATSNPVTVDVKPAIPAPPSAITGSTQVCPGTVVTFSVTQVAGVKYNWTLPAGWSGTSTTNSINVTTGNYGQNGNISVTAEDANDASCGISTAKTLAISVKPGTPAEPSFITSTLVICPNTTNTYTVANDIFATSYVWTLPSGWTGSSTSTSINATSNSTGGNIKVRAINDCGDSTEKIIAVTVKNGTPAMPLNLSGSNAVCPNTTETYTVTNDATATEYIWTLPNGWTGTSTSSSITVNTATSGSGNITVKAKNDCGTSAPASIAVNIKAPAPVMSGVISGNNTVCHNSTGLYYSIPVITNATNYQWTVPNGWNITNITNTTDANGNNINRLTVSASTTDGSISVIAQNDCGDSAASANFAVTSTDNLPTTPGAITSSLAANPNVCPPATGMTFRVDPVSNATGYNWIMPAGWEITSGANTNSIIARANANTPFPATQSVRVETTNICGKSTGQSVFNNITIDDHISVDLGPDKTVCRILAGISINANVTFGGATFKPTLKATGRNNDVGFTAPNSVKGDFVITYTPIQADLDRGQVTINLTVPKPNGSSGNSLCGTGEDEMVIFFRPDPTASITGTSTICTGNATNITFTASANSVVTYKINGGSNQTISVGSSGTATLNTGALTTNTTYTIESVAYTGTLTCPKIFTVKPTATVSITPPPTATISYAQPFCNSNSANQTVTKTGTGNGTYSAGTTGLTINPQSGAVTPNSSTPGIHTVTLTIPASGGCPEYTTTTNVQIIEKVQITSSPQDVQVCEGQQAQFNVTASGENLTYQWYKGVIGSGTAISGATATSFTINTAALTDNGDYYITVSGSSPCSSENASFTLTVDEKINITAQPANQEVCENGSVTLNVIASAGTNPLTYQWYKGTPGTGTLLNGKTNDNLTFSPALPADAGSYYVEIDASGTYNCSQVTSQAASITIKEILTVEMNSDESQLCDGGNTQLNFINGTPNSVVTYSKDGVNQPPITINASGQGTVNTGALNSAGTTSKDYIYQLVQVEYLNPPPCTIDLSTIPPVSITINANPSVDIGYNGITAFCNSDNTTYSITTSNESGDWENGTFTVNPAMTIDPVTGSFNPINIPANTYTITYTTPANGGCSASSSTIDITIHDKVEISTQPSNLGICSSQSASFNVIATGSNLTYQWFKDGAPIAGATSAELNYNNATSSEAGSYYVEVTGNSPCNKVPSETVTLNVDEEIVIIEPATDIEICANDTNPVKFKFIAHADGEPLKFEWYKKASPNDLIQTNTAEIDTISYSPGTDPANPSSTYYSGTLSITGITEANKGNFEGVYYVKILSKNPSNFTCPDAVSKTFSLSILEVPALPVTVDLTYCTGDTAPALTATGNNLLWYSTDISDDGTSTAPTPDTSIESTTTYWVSQTPGFCESERTPLTVTVNLKPEPPTGDTDIHYCQGDTVNPFNISGSNLTWYSDAGLQNVISEPVVNTAVVESNSYWVTQTENYTENSCSSESLKVDVTVHTLPVIDLTSQFDTTICSGTSTQLYASGAFTYEWFDENNVSLGTGDTKSVSLNSTTTFKVIGYDTNNRCSAENTITINVDEPSNGGTLAGATAVCASGNSGTLSLSGYVGTIQRWESSVDNWVTKEDITEITETITYSNLAQTTKYRAVVKNGVCGDAFSAEAIISVDPVPIGGKLLFNKNNERIYLTCEQPNSSSLSDITLSLYSGTVVNWKYRKSSSSGWTIIPNSAGITTLTAAQIHALGITETMVFQVEMASGACSPNALSQTAILSVIPSDIEPTPVTIDPDVICFGDEVTLASSTGYTDRPNFLDQGAFDNASITNHGWRVRRNGNPTDIGFDTDANNTRPDRWKRATRHQFTTASITSPYTTREDLYISSNGPNDPSGNKGFAVVSSNNSATLETPVFAIGGLDQAILTWDQMYNLTPGASIKVEISTDGGNTYSNVLYSQGTAPDPPNTTGVSSSNYDGFSLGTVATRPNNKMQVDLGYYMGQQQLRIRFHYTGVRLGDVWAIDNIDIPDGPRGVELVWYDYTDPDNPIYIGNSETETWFPSKIGYNEFEVRTKLLLDSSGTACQSIENFERVSAFAFDQYVSTTTVVTGTCGTTEAQLSGVVVGTGTLVAGTGPINNVPPQGIITTFPTLDGYTASWEAIDTNGNIVPNSYFYNEDGSTTNAINNPNAIFNPGTPGTFTLTWKLSQTAFVKDNQGNDFSVPVNDGCPPIYEPADMSTLDCTTLDFDGNDDYVDLGTTYTGTYSIEAWIRPEASTGTIISGPSFEIKMADLPSISPGTRWYHVAVSNGRLYIDGIDISVSNSGTGGNNTLIGARWNNNTGKAENHFSGWIEEVRIWNTAISQEQIQFMMNQHLQNAANMGIEIPMPVPGGLNYANLAGYYRLISNNPDPLNLGAPWGVTFAAALMPANGLTPDLASASVPGRLHNMTTDQENTAPLPYISARDGQTWATDNTWLRPAVWDAPNSDGIDNSTSIDWNIVRINHNINSGNRDITVLGLKSETVGKLLNISRTGTPDEYDPGQMLRVTHYLLLDGNIDLVGESQLLQDSGSILAESSAGWLERDQQGKKLSFNYNYWSSPVSAQGSANNSAYLPVDVMSYDVGGGSIMKLQFTADSDPYGADNTNINTCPYWLWKFKGDADDYDSWQFIGRTGALQTGEGHTMKGTYFDGTNLDYDNTQNYIYKGKPHNGDFMLNIGSNQNYLIGNPYPSALDVEKFINDNISQNVFNGALYFWDHFSGGTHVLREYIGGYAVANLTGGVQAASVDDRIDNSNPNRKGAWPGDFIPVGQGFFVTTLPVEGSNLTFGGDIVFKNSQRVFAREEGSTSSTFLKPENVTKTGKEEAKNSTPKIRISFNSPKGYIRQLLVGAHPATTNGFDLGYDAPMIDYNVEDMFWLQGNNYLVIQGVPDFGKAQVLPLGIRIEKEGEFKIKIDTLENINDDHTIYLKDIVLDTIHDIRSGPYVSTSVAGEITERFQLIFYKESTQDPVIDEPIIDEPIIDDLTDISLLHSYTENEMMVLNPQELLISAIYLFDMNGKLLSVFEDVPSEKEIRLKVANFSEGVYVLKMHTDNEIVTRKIIIKN